MAHATLDNPGRKISRKRWVISFLIMAPLVFIWALFLGGDLRTFKVISGSMLPSLEIGDCVLMEKVTDHEDLKGKIVVFDAPDKPGQELTKRVIAQKDDLVELRDGNIYVNGYPETSQHQPIEKVPDSAWRLTDDKVFILGDNRNESFDSIDFGPIDRSLIKGVLTYRYWPIYRAGGLYGEE